jgi:Ubiquitin carboxyl-terminal hydrolase
VFELEMMLHAYCFFFHCTQAAAATGSNGTSDMSYTNASHKQYQQQRQQYQHGNMQHNSKPLVSQHHTASAEDDNTDGNTTSSTNDCVCIACELDMFFHDLYDKDTSTLTMVSTYNTSIISQKSTPFDVFAMQLTLCDALTIMFIYDHVCNVYQEDIAPCTPHRILQAIWNTSESLAGYQQQDSHEFLITLLDSFHVDLMQFNAYETRVQRLEAFLLQQQKQSQVSCVHNCKACKFIVSIHHFTTSLITTVV